MRWVLRGGFCIGVFEVSVGVTETNIGVRFVVIFAMAKMILTFI